MTEIFIQAFVYLVAAVIAVPIAKRLGLGSVLGYLIAGVLIGPVFGFVGKETVTIQHFAEFGVVMMLFLVGMELEPQKLWAMKHRLLGLGGMQVGGTTVIIMGVAMLCGQTWSVALAIGLIFSLSSTAIVLQTFNEKRMTKTEGAQNAFSVLLFQDIAVIPMLAFIPLLAMPELAEHIPAPEAGHHEVAHPEPSHAGGDHHDAGHGGGGHHEEISLVDGLPGWAYALVIIGSIVSLTVGGHFLSRPLFRYIANTGLREIFTATALLLVIGIAALMSLIGLSPALGTFLAGVVLANSEFRHELESDIEPFKGLLLGLFFITVGAGIDVAVLSSQIGLVLGLTAAVMVTKALILFVIALVFKVQGRNRWLLTLSLAQAGEFGFVLLSFSVQNNVLPSDLGQLLALPVAFSMFLTPGLFILFEKVIQPRYQKTSNERETDSIDETGTVIIAGIGRVGQIINRLLVSNGYKTVVLDHQPRQVDVMRRIGTKAYFGDATRPDLLHTAGIQNAAAVVVAIDNKESSVELVKYIRHAHPHVKVIARAFDRGHLYRLREADAHLIESETYHTALELGVQTLRTLGTHPFSAEQQRAAFRTVEDQKSDLLYETWLDDSEGERFDDNYRKLFMQLEEQIAEAMGKDKRGIHSLAERVWTPPPKDYLNDFTDESTEG